MKTISKQMFSTAIAAALLSLWLSGCNSEQPDAEQTAGRVVSIRVIEEVSALHTRALPGQARAAREVHLAFRVNGPLRELPVVVGQELKKGDLIARIDPRDFRVRSAQLEAQLATLQARMVNVRRHYERLLHLFEIDAAPEADFDQARAAFDALTARIEATSQELQAARNALADTELRAPFEGYIHEKFVENFDYVTVQQPIVSFLDYTVIEVTAGLPEELLAGNVRLKQFRCSFDVYPGRTFDAQLKELARKPYPSNQTYVLTVAFDNPDESFILPGMTATLQIGFHRGDDMPAVSVPLPSVLNDARDQSYVWLFDPQTRTVTRRDVQTGPLTANGIQITRGLSAGDHIVEHGARFLYAGQKVRPAQTH